MDIYGTHVLARVVENLDQPSSFLLDTFFPFVQTSDSEEIVFDVDMSKPRITPFVHPTRAGVVVEGQGYATKSLKPAYAKDKRRLMPNAPLKRRAGERIGGTLSPMERRERQLAEELADQLDMLTRREEVMAAEALLSSKVTVSGEGYPAVVVDFGRHGDLTKALLTTARWGEAGVRPLRNIEAWSAEVQSKAGVAATTVVMDPLAAQLLKDDAEVRELMDLRRGVRGEVDLGPVARGQGNDKAVYLGMVGAFAFWQYQDVYVGDDGLEAKLLPDYTVIIGARGQAGTGRGGLEGTRAYGVIQDEKANYKAQRFFTKSWLEEDPAVRWLLMQSAPLVFPYRPNASAAITVR